MPLIDSSTYQAPRLLRNSHLQTIYSNIGRQQDRPDYQRERLELADGDFLDLDWSRVGSDRLAVISHGLEGHSHRAYVLGMVHALNRAGWDCLAWNFRGCSGEPNRLLRFTHNGSTEDLGAVVERAAAEGYRRIDLVGFSMGGNLSLLYLGREGGHPRIGRGVFFSVPCDLEASALQMERWSNWLYMKRFLVMLHEKVKTYQGLHPGLIDDDGYGSIRTFCQFDGRYTAPLHGFQDAEDYWHKSSCGPYLPEIKVPVLIISSRDDPFLAPACYPVEAARESRLVHLEMPRRGGHVGFVSRGKDGRYWSEDRAVEFLTPPGPA